MKKLLCAAFAAVIAAVTLFLPACAADKDNLNAFCFLSVRIKGNGDGTITALATNEFSLSGAFPVTLFLLRSELPAAPEEMTTAAGTQTTELKPLCKLEISVGAEGGGYFCALAEYVVNGETRQILSDAIQYDGNGNRI